MSEHDLPEEAVLPVKRTWKEIQIWTKSLPSGYFYSIPKKQFGVWYQLRKYKNSNALFAFSQDYETGLKEMTMVPWNSIPKTHIK